MQTARPMRIMPGGLDPMPTSNPGIDAYYREREYQGQQRDRDETQRQRQQELDTQAAIRRSLEETSDAPAEEAAPAPMAPSPAPPRLGAVSTAPTSASPPAMEPSVVPPARSASPLSSVSTTATPSPAVDSSGLGAVSSAEPPMEEIGVSAARDMPTNKRSGALGRINSLDQSLERNLTSVNPREALKVRQGSNKRSLEEIEAENAKELEVLKLANGGDVDGATTLARQYGLNIDPQILGNAELTEAAIYAGETAKAVGASHDEAWIERFMGNFLQTRDARAALKAAGKPSAPPAKAGTFKPTVLEKDGKRSYGAFDTRSGTITDTNQGAPAAAAGRAGGAAGKEVAMMDFLVSKGIVDGANEQEKYRNAAKWVQTSKSNPNARTNLIVSAAARMAANDTFARQATRAGKDPMAEAMRSVQSAVSAAEGGGDPEFYDLPDGKRVFTTDGQNYYYSDGTGKYDGPFGDDEEKPEESDEE